MWRETISKNFLALLLEGQDRSEGGALKLGLATFPLSQAGRENSLALALVIEGDGRLRVPC